MRRAAIAIVLRVNGPCSPVQETGAIQTLGYTIAIQYPMKAVADAMAYEVDRGWMQRVGKGLYVRGGTSIGREYRILALFP